MLRGVPPREVEAVVSDWLVSENEGITFFGVESAEENFVFGRFPRGGDSG